MAKHLGRNIRPGAGRPDSTPNVSASYCSLASWKYITALVDEDGKALDQRRRRWPRLVRRGLLVLLALVLIFHRQIIFGVGRSVANRYAARANLKIDCSLEGTIFTGLVVRNLRVVPIGPTIVESIDVDYIRADYSLLDLWRQGATELLKNAEVRTALAERFGTTDRSAIAGIVFEDRQQLHWLEQLLHPRVQAEYARWREALAQAPEPPALAVVEIPLLYETGSDARFDAVVVITAPEELRAARRSVRPDSRANRLLPDEEKIRRATYAYVNDGTVEELDEFVAGVVRALAASG